MNSLTVDSYVYVGQIKRCEQFHVCLQHLNAFITRKLAIANRSRVMRTQSNTKQQQVLIIGGGGFLTGQEACQFHANSHELISACLACPPNWAQGPLPLRAERRLPPPGWRAPVVRILFSRQSVLLSNFSTMVWEVTKQLSCTGVDR